MSIHERSAELIDLIDRTGMRGELDARDESQNLEKRKRLVAERKGLLEERDRVMPALDAEVVAAREAYALAEQKLQAARQVMHYTQMRAYGKSCSYGTAQLDSAIERNAPQFMRDAFDTLQEPIDFLGGTVWFVQQRKRVGWNFHNIDVSNVAEVSALRHKCEEGQAEIRAMMYDTDSPLDAQRPRCAAIVAECVALTRPHLKDDRHWLAHQERKERAKKSA